jgi:hypothetical protein
VDLDVITQFRQCGDDVELQLARPLALGLELYEERPAAGDEETPVRPAPLAVEVELHLEDAHGVGIVHSLLLGDCLPHPPQYHRSHSLLHASRACAQTAQTSMPRRNTVAAAASATSGRNVT